MGEMKEKGPERRRKSFKSRSITHYNAPYVLPSFKTYWIVISILLQSNLENIKPESRKWQVFHLIHLAIESWDLILRCWSKINSDLWSMNWNSGRCCYAQSLMPRNTLCVNAIMIVLMRTVAKTRIHLEETIPEGVDTSNHWYLAKLRAPMRRGIELMRTVAETMIHRE